MVTRHLEEMERHLLVKARHFTRQGAKWRGEIDPVVPEGGNTITPSGSPIMKGIPLIISSKTKIDPIDPIVPGRSKKMVGNLILRRKHGMVNSEPLVHACMNEWWKWMCVCIGVCV